MTTRRDFLTAAGASALTLGLPEMALAAAARAPLIDGVKSVCRRLAAAGWRRHLLDVTGGALDITAIDLPRELAKPLRTIDRSVPGFGDFALAGTRGIEPGQPALSLLYHALASPDVVADRDGRALGDFATPAEIEAVENYVYGVRPPTVAALRQRAGDRPLGIVVFALGYRTAAASVQGRHADLCFSRTGIARLGTDGPRYSGRDRAFDAYDAAQPAAFRVVPQRFAAYLAMRASGDKDRFGPQDFLAEDATHDFWIPLHKLFDGPECIAGRDLRVGLRSHLINEKLRRFHRYMEITGYRNDWTGDDLGRFPFTIRDAMIGGLSRKPELGSGMLEPRPHPFSTPATYRGKPLTFTVDGRFTGSPGNLYFSSMQILPGEGDVPPPTYFESTVQSTDRLSPEYANIRHPVGPNGKVGNLNRNPELARLLRTGGYKALHYIDFAGDGWIEALCPALADEIPLRAPAFCLVAPPDFFPKIGQREMMNWWRTAVPEALRAGLWAVPPLALSQLRMAADITLPAGFSINDTGVTAIVSQPAEAAAPQQQSNGASGLGYSGLPDNANGLFDPGWDASQGIYFSDPDLPLQKFLQGYGLGSPFVEDVKICAALGSYWPAVAPDTSRTFTPIKRGPGFDFPWPTVAPLTDAEIGIVPMPDGKLAPWDGVRGPRLKTVGGRAVVAYADFDRVDYLDMPGTLTGVHLARIGIAEYQARILAMAAVYWSLGIHDPEILERHGSEHRVEAVHEIILAKAGWAVLSFRAVAAGDAELAEAERATARQLTGERRYRFHLFRPGAESVDPGDIGTVLVELGEQAIAYVDPEKVLLRRGDQPWQCDTSIPTS